MKKFFIPIALLSLCTIICACTLKSNSETETPQIVTETTWDNTDTWIKIEPFENTDIDTNIDPTKGPEKVIEPTTCTADVKQCNDGSYVSRWWPNCEFSPCPWENLDKNTNIIIDNATWNEKLDTDEIIDKLTEYSKSWDFDEEWVDILYQIIDSLSE